MRKALIIKNARLEGAGTIGKLLESDGFDLDMVYAKREKIPKLEHDVLVVLGAPQSANDDLPYLKEEMDLIRSAAQKNIPTLGICLGSQLMAKAFGAKVYPGPKKEIGFYDNVTLDGDSDLFSGMTSPLSVFHWHGDTFDIPEKATRLAHSDLYNQAFRYGSAVGLQFHLEVDKETVLTWLDNTKEQIDLPYIDPQKIRDEVDSKIQDVQKNMKIFYKNFKSVFNI